MYNSCTRSYVPGLWALLLLLLLVLLLLGGCETAQYYTQAAGGQLRILAARKSIDKVIAAPGTQEKLQQQLREVQGIRAYAGGELQLPVDSAYGDFVQLGEDFPLWNVFAAPEFSLDPKRWCYPIAGCASYRGYFRKADAELKARQLRGDGYDVYLGPVPAYSTLGWFDDPVLSSFVNWPADRLAGLLFHELAHRRVYIAGDTGFNESFATAVSQIALPDWRRRRGLEGPAIDGSGQSRQLNRLMLEARTQLKTIYASEQSDEQKRAAKAETLSRLRQCYRQLSAAWPNPERYRAYLEKTNNATLALVAEYQSQVPAFEQLYRESGNWPAFYSAVERLGKLDKDRRKQRLEELAAGAGASDGKAAAPFLDSDACMSAGSRP